MAEQEKIIRDLTEGSVSKTLLKFSAPLLLSGLLQMVYNMVDMVVVGRFKGTEGLSAVSIGGELLMLITFVAMGLSNAGQVIISRYVGADRRDRVGRIVGTLLSIAMGLGLIIMVVFLFMYKIILGWLNTPAEIWDYTCDYSFVCICGILFIYGFNVSSAILRGMGDSKHPFIFIAIASVINIALDILFVGPLDMGPMGAALATVIGQAVSCVLAFRLLYKNRKEIHFDFKPKSFVPDRSELRPLLSLGIPMVIQSAAITFSMLFVNAFVNSYGPVAVAVTGVARKLENMIGVVSQAISSASAAMTAQCLGAGKTKKVPKIYVTALWIVAIPAAIFAVVTFFKPEWLFGLFSDDAAVLAMATTYVPVALIQYLGCALRPANLGLINGSGHSILNFMIAIIDGIVARIGLALLLGVVLNWGIFGFWYGNAFSGLVPMLIGGIYLASGLWKRRAAGRAPSER